MGQIPFRWATPDGYPDTKDEWASSIGVLTRWNYGLSLCGAGGARANARLKPKLATDFTIANQTPGSISTAGEALDFWIDRILHREMAPGDRAIVLDFLTDGGNDDTALAGATRGRLATTIALIFDSPYFHWR